MNCAAQTPTPAQDPPLALSVEGVLSATDNGNAGAAGDRRGDLIASVRPELRWKRRSPLLDVDLTAATTLVGYAGGSSEGGLLPDVRASLRSTWVPHWLVVDAGAQVKQTERDAYGTRADDAPVANRRTESTYNLRPHVEHLVAQDTLMLAAYDVTLTTNAAGAGAQAVASRGVARIERLPLPFGASAEWSRLATESRDTERSRLTVQTARASAGVALAQEWILGIVAGQDRTRFLSRDHTDPLYGVDLKWNPTPRTSVVVDVENRFFGVGGNISASHRTPYLSFGVTLSRQPSLAANALRVLGTAADLRTYLDAILTTRHPDQTLRDGVVETLVRNQGLDTRLPTASDVVADYPQLQTALDAHLTLLGRRDAASFSVYVRTSRLLSHRADPPVTALAIADDDRQAGASFQFSHRLNPQVSADLIARWSRIIGLADRTGDRSSEALCRLSLMRHTSAQTALSVGLEHRRFATSVASQTSYAATTLFVGASHRF